MVTNQYNGMILALVFLNETWNTKEQRFPFFLYPRSSSSFRFATFSPLKRIRVQYVSSACLSGFHLHLKQDSRPVFPYLRTIDILGWVNHCALHCMPVAHTSTSSSPSSSWSHQKCLLTLPNVP